MINISKGSLAFEAEPLIAPFGFKTGYLEELWQSIVYLRSDDGLQGLGLGVQSVLWCDAAVFAGHSASVGNCMMHQITERAIKLAMEEPMDSPVVCMQRIFPRVMEYARQVTGRDDLRPSFALNAMSPVDFALWMMHAQRMGTQDFRNIIPEDVQPAMDAKHASLGMIPMVTYDTSMPNVRKMAQEGCFLIKIKLGADPDRDGDPVKMLAWDVARLKQIHEALKDYTTPYTQSGHIAYYLDANGRYDSAERIMRLLEAVDAMGAMERVLLLEEPFAEGAPIEVGGFGVRIGADESAQGVENVRRLIDLGYGAIALNPLAKTLSMSFLMAKEAHRHDVPCFCTDLTAGPNLLEWNQAFAACLPSLPGILTGIVETNGAQYYSNWNKMLEYAGHMPWLIPSNGLFQLGDHFNGGGIFAIPPHYRQMIR